MAKGLQPAKAQTWGSKSAMQSLCYIVFPETDRYQRTFGEEYLYALHQSRRRQDAAKRRRDPAKPPRTAHLYLDGVSFVTRAGLF